MLILDQNSDNLNALQEYNREVSKRIGILKNNQNKYFARYEFDKRIKDMEKERRDKIETGYRNKLKIIREKELQRGYDILTLESSSNEPKREKKIIFVDDIHQETNDQNEEYNEGLININKRKSNYSQLESLRNTNNLSIHPSINNNESNGFLKRVIHNKSFELPFKLDKRKLYNRDQRDRNRRLREGSQNQSKQIYNYIQLKQNNSLSRQNLLSKSHNTIEIQNNRSFL